MSGFSAAVKIVDLDDFLSPAPDCVILPAAKPTEDPVKKASVIKSKKNKENDQVASIALSDCLACSGCVTSAETVLLESQSVEQLLSQSSSARTIYVSVSSPSRRALSECYNIRASRVCEFLESKLRALFAPSAVVVLDTSVAEAIVVGETMKEIKSRKEVVITSHCPGWTCYATKTMDQSTVLSHMSRVKSPEQLQGLIVKQLLPAVSLVHQTRRNFNSFSLQRSQKDILHVLVSPCFDKKLEIVRPDYTAGTARAVDLVLATSEVVDLMTRTVSCDDSFLEKYLDIHDVFSLRDSWAAASSGCESGGYAQAATGSSENIPWVKGKNPDLLEHEKSLRSHGFRNIQNVVRRLKTGKLDGHKIVELMACPGGCMRGGGQLHSASKLEKRDETSSIWKKWAQFFYKSNSIVPDPNEIRTICPAEEYLPAKVLRQAISEYFGVDFLAKFLTTEWKSIAAPEPSENGGIHLSSVKW